MKKSLIITLLFVLAGATIGLAQDQYHETMLKSVKAFDKAVSAEDYTELANIFERIGFAEQDKWHPFYYQALCLNAKSFEIEGADARDKLIDQAEAALQKATELGCSEAEAAVLQARIYQARLSVNPASRTVIYGPKTTMLLAQTRAKAPENPRVLFLLGQNLLFTPEGLGGGIDKALPLIEGAVKIFRASSNEDTLDPSWGQEEAEGLLSSLKEKMED
jgi:hypothetical protein